MRINANFFKILKLPRWTTRPNRMSKNFLAAEPMLLHSLYFNFKFRIHFMQNGLAGM